MKSWLPASTYPCAWQLGHRARTEARLMGRARAESRAKVVDQLDGTVRGELERDLVVNKVRLVCERAALPFIVTPVR